MKMKVHHVGYLVKKIEKAAVAFEALGYTRISRLTADEDRGIDILFLEKDGYVIELVSPNRTDSIVSGLIKTYKNSPYHICYASDRFEEDLAGLEAGGYIRMGEPARAVAIEGKRVVFLMSPVLGMIEVIEGIPDCF